MDSTGFCGKCGELVTGAFCSSCGTAREPGELPLRRPERVVVIQQRSNGHGMPALFSLIIPGLGQIVKGEVGKGIVVLAMALVSVALITAFIGVLTTPILWIWNVYDAYRNDPEPPQPTPGSLGAGIVLLLALAGVGCGDGDVDSVGAELLCDPVLRGSHLVVTTPQDLNGCAVEPSRRVMENPILAARSCVSSRNLGAASCALQLECSDGAASWVGAATIMADGSAASDITFRRDGAGGCASRIRVTFVPCGGVSCE